ncbi:hypothetical protein JTE90_025487 [Oedothorax gibbosus]|uniref:Uncharacterized protein n=1 Tax=Oedothorax gibbosus TaxID=931172 RepID=A0AAV6UXJ1_9ARAC|nr:hypothetical protein JTE90_025487 [Oedothorax gibbosus]
MPHPGSESRYEYLRSRLVQQCTLPMKEEEDDGRGHPRLCASKRKSIPWAETRSTWIEVGCGGREWRVPYRLISSR